MKPAFTCQYYLENDTYYVLEIKRTDLAPETEIYLSQQWVYVDKQNLTVSPLTLRSSDSAGEVKECFFDQGYLKFNKQNGTFIEKFNSGQHQLENRTGNAVETSILEIIGAFLAK